MMKRKSLWYSVPTGQKTRSFTLRPKVTRLISRMRETQDDKLVFVETDVHGSADIISIRYNRPLHSRENITGGQD